jgi:hypothetical protein
VEVPAGIVVFDSSVLINTYEVLEHLLQF